MSALPATMCADVWRYCGRDFLDHCTPEISAVYLEGITLWTLAEYADEFPSRVLVAIKPRVEGSRPTICLQRMTLEK